MTNRKKISPEDKLPIGPLTVEPLQWDHGASLAICHKVRGVIATIEPINADDDVDIESAKREPWDQSYATLFAAAPEMLKALKCAQEMMEYAHKKFDWAGSCLDAKAIQMLNDAPIMVYNAIAIAEERAEVVDNG